MAAEMEQREQAPPPQRATNRSVLFNIPNQITSLRLLLSIVLFVLIGRAQAVIDSAASTAGLLYLIAMVVFAVAAGTDWVDGYVARKYGQVTTLGRIFDPFVDKIIISGAFIFLVASPGSGITAWMATVVVGRELLVTVLRGYVEQQGGDFSARMAGKLKMVLQCLAVGASLFALSYTGEAVPPAWVTLLLHMFIWSAILLTVYSGIGYVISAARMLRE